jgi:hypothetical protein
MTQLITHVPPESLVNSLLNSGAVGNWSYQKRKAMATGFTAWCLDPKSMAPEAGEFLLQTLGVRKHDAHRFWQYIYKGRVFQNIIVLEHDEDIPHPDSVSFIAPIIKLMRDTGAIPNIITTPPTDREMIEAMRIFVRWLSDPARRPLIKRQFFYLEEAAFGTDGTVCFTWKHTDGSRLVINAHESYNNDFLEVRPINPHKCESCEEETPCVNVKDSVNRQQLCLSCRADMTGKDPLESECSQYECCIGDCPHCIDRQVFKQDMIENSMEEYEQLELAPQ